MRNSLFVFLFFGVVGCSEVPPPEPDLVVTNLASYFAPQSSVERQLWEHNDLRAGMRDSLYYFEFIGQSANPTADGNTPVSIYQYSDSASQHRIAAEYYVSDSLVVSYGDSSSKLDTRLYILRDTLQKGRSWQASADYLTPDSAHVSLSASTSQYYPNIRVGDSVYINVFRVEYLVRSLGKGSILPEYADSSKHVWYFAHNVGVVLQYIYDKAGATLWTNELLEQRLK
jgi:hypothetical protein